MKYKKQAEKIAEEMMNEKILDLNHDSDFKNLVLTAKIGGVEYNVWRSDKKDGKFEVMKIVSPSSKKADKDEHKRMAMEEIVEDIVKKALKK